MAEVNLDAMEAQIAQMTPEQIRAELFKIKTKQRVTQKKYYNPETAKRARLKKAEEVNALVAAAKKAGIYEEILDAANKAADEELAAAETGEDND